MVHAQFGRTQFQPTHPVWGETFIHKLLLKWSTSFNPPTPCGAGRRLSVIWFSGSEFQSTRPVRGGTSQRIPNNRAHTVFNPPAPCGAGSLRPSCQPSQPCFNPPSPRWGRDDAGSHSAALPHGFFNPPSSPEEGHLLLVQCTCLRRISIHAPRAGRDQFPGQQAVEQCNFNPPTQCGTRPQKA